MLSTHQEQKQITELSTKSENFQIQREAKDPDVCEGRILQMFLR